MAASQSFGEFVSEIVSQLDLTALKEAYAGRGSSAYHPEMLPALPVYDYDTGVFSSRRLERSTYNSVAFRYLAENGLWYAWLGK